jgi:hypothetical protein
MCDISPCLSLSLSLTHTHSHKHTKKKLDQNSSNQLARARLQQLKMGVAPDLAPNGNILCAATLQTGFVAENGNKVVVGCMLQVTVRQGTVLVAVRTASQQVTSCMSSVVSGLLK